MELPIKAEIAPIAEARLFVCMEGSVSFKWVYLWNIIAYDTVFENAKTRPFADLFCERAHSFKNRRARFLPGRRFLWCGAF